MARSSTHIADPARITCLASPLRMEIIDVIESLGGEAGAADIAHELGRPMDGLYYHLRALVGAGLLEAIGTSVRKQRWRSIAGSGRLVLRYVPGTRASMRSVGAVSRGVLRLAARDFTRALARRDTVAEGPRRELWVARNQGWVTHTELAEINRLLRRVQELLGARRDQRRRRRLAVAWVLAPLPVRKARR
jgi:DNA-binding transcriptional ArsR family regulator